jgi:hypothetical protein
MTEDVHMYVELVIKNGLRTCTLEDVTRLLGLYKTTPRLFSLHSSHFYTAETL